MNVTYFDIETGPLPDDQLAKLKPEFSAPANYKDPAKIAANIIEQELAWRERATLDASTGRVLTVGILSGEFFHACEGIPAGDEKTMLGIAWEIITEKLYAGNVVIGFCIFNFDLPFLIRRSWVNSVSIPQSIRHGRYWHENFIDLAEVWQCGNREQRISLDGLAKCLGVGAKNGSGADFAELWKTDKSKALEYLSNDLALTKACAERMGIIP